MHQSQNTKVRLPLTILIYFYHFFFISIFSNSNLKSFLLQIKKFNSNNFFPATKKATIWRTFQLTCKLKIARSTKSNRWARKCQKKRFKTKLLFRKFKIKFQNRFENEVWNKSESHFTCRLETVWTLFAKIVAALSLYNFVRTS